MGEGAGMGHVLLTNKTLNHGQYIMYDLLLPYGFGCIKWEYISFDKMKINIMHVNNLKSMLLPEHFLSKLFCYN